LNLEQPNLPLTEDTTRSSGSVRSVFGWPSIIGWSAACVAVAVFSFWARAIWEASSSYDPTCVGTPTSECIESLRRTASWDAPLNDSAKAAMRDLELLANSSSPLAIAAAQGLTRARATTRSIFDSTSPRLPHDLDPVFAALAFVAFLVWAGGAFTILRRGFTRDGTFKPREVAGRVCVVVAAFFVWLFALSNA
jgi:hypothetical protein